MKNPLQNLLISLALGLCALVAVQWHREVRLRQTLQSAREEARSQADTILNLQQQLRVAEAEIQRLGSLRSRDTAYTASNQMEIGALKTQLERAEAEITRGAKQVEAFKSALQKANDNIQRQNESLKKFANERNEAVLRFNKLTEEYNVLVRRWNEQQKAPSVEAAP